MKVACISPYFFALGESIYNKVFFASSPLRWHLRRNLRQHACRIPPAQLLLDLGAGYSPHKALFHFNQYISLDLDRKRKVDLQASIDALPIRDGKADIVLCVEVLEHLEQPKQGLSEIRRVLKPNGYLILTVPFVYGEHGTDYHRWTGQGLRKILTEQDFEVVEILKQGGAFTVIAETLVMLPYQMFTPSPAHRRTWQSFPWYFAQTLGRLILMPLIILLMVADIVDRKKNFTTGYSVLARKSAKSPVAVPSQNTQEVVERWIP